LGKRRASHRQGREHRRLEHRILLHGHAVRSLFAHPRPQLAGPHAL
jgi:hypothetical protein